MPNCRACFQGQSGHVPLKIFRKGSWPGPRNPLNFWSRELPHSLSALVQSLNDRPFNFHMKLKREEYKRLYTMAHKWAWSCNATKFIILHPLNYFLQQLTDGRVFNFYTELTRENKNNIYIQEPANSRVVEFCVMLTSVTKSRDHFGLYSLTGSTSVSMSMFTLTAM